ncbi:MAG: hypothetical protein PHQ62_04180 [Clostridia bacterium]|nr:hypothetical protein [Clostridia bacterium]
MKGRKFNIIFNLSTLILVIAFSAVSVYAATMHSLATTATVSFTATSISGNISGTVSGISPAPAYAQETFNPNSSPTATYNLPAWTIGSAGTPATWTNTNGVPGALVFTITIGNTTTGSGMKVQIKNIINGGYTLTSVTEKANGSESTATDVDNDSGTYTMVTITSSQSSILYITLNVTDFAVSVTGGAISFGIEITKA